MSAPSTSDLEQAQRFLQILIGGDSATFQTFSDREGLKRVLLDGKSYDPNAGWRHGTLEALALHLMRQNAKGAGVFVMVNEGDGKGRTAANVKLVRALFLDTDGAPYPADLPLKPHLVVESSPGKWHLYWLVTGIELGDFAIFQQALAEYYGTDPSVKDPARVMRLPGTYHRKGEPMMVKLLEAQNHRSYTPAEVYAAWPFLPERLKQVRALEAEREQKRADVLKRGAARRAAPTLDTGNRARAERLLQAHHDTVASAGDGTRHDTLLRAARALGGYVGSGYLEADEVEDTLLAAAEVCDLPESEAAGVIRWGLEKGANDPLELAPSPTFDAKRVFSAEAVASNKSCAARAKTLLMQSCNNANGKFNPFGKPSRPKLSGGRPKLGGKPCLS